MSDREDREGAARGVATGVGVALGAGLGAAVFAITDDPLWIAAGAAAGVILGAVVDVLRPPDSRDP